MIKEKVILVLFFFLVCCRFPLYELILVEGEAGVGGIGSSGYDFSSAILRLICLYLFRDLWKQNQVMGWKFG